MDKRDYALERSETALKRIKELAESGHIFLGALLNQDVNSALRAINDCK